jgi:hypothetical protein
MVLRGEMDIFMELLKTQGQGQGKKLGGKDLHVAFTNKKSLHL